MEDLCCSSFENRKFVGIELWGVYYAIVKDWIQPEVDITVRVCPNQPVTKSNPKMVVTKLLKD